MNILGVLTSFFDILQYLLVHNILIARKVLPYQTVAVLDAVQTVNKLLCPIGSFRYLDLTRLGL